ncbi:MAG: DUF2589 domain-containing protein [bacterium]|nr:DUF2589 domain-containing protein [bacterium]
MSRAVGELRQIPFEQLIGGPMKAAIEAQALAAQSTIEFIHKVGFKQPVGTGDDLLFADTEQDADAGDLRNVTFSYEKKDENEDPQTFKLTVPLLTITPVPYIRIDEMTIDFKAKLTDTVVRKTNSSFSLDSTVSGKFSSFWSPVKISWRVSAAYKTSSSTAASQKREYSLDVHVRAVQDEMPAGLSKILDILEDAIKDEPATT